MEDNEVGDKKLLVARSTRDVGRYIEGCNLCQKIKNCMESLARKLIANEILEKLWIYLIVDFIIKSLLVVRKDVILVVCNKLSKMTHIFSNNEREELAQLFRNNM